MALTINIQYLGDPLGAIFLVIWVNLGHLGPNWRPNRKIWVIMGPMSPLLAAKKGFNIPLYQVQWTDYQHKVIVGALNVHQALFV